MRYADADLDPETYAAMLDASCTDCVRGLVLCFISTLPRSFLDYRSILSVHSSALSHNPNARPPFQPRYNADVMAIIGTILNWMTFPSFNAYYAPEPSQQVSSPTSKPCNPKPKPLNPNPATHNPRA
jgi:hypothetical protein